MCYSIIPISNIEQHVESNYPAAYAQLKSNPHVLEQFKTDVNHKDNHMLLQGMVDAGKGSVLHKDYMPDPSNPSHQRKFGELEQKNAVSHS